MKAAVEVMIQTVTGNHQTKIFFIRRYSHSYSSSNSFFIFIRDGKLHSPRRPFFAPSSYCLTTPELNTSPHSISITLLTIRWVTSFIELTIMYHWFLCGETPPTHLSLLWSLGLLPKSHFFAFVNGPLLGSSTFLTWPLSTTQHMHWPEMSKPGALWQQMLWNIMKTIIHSFLFPLQADGVRCVWLGQVSSHYSKGSDWGQDQGRGRMQWINVKLYL